jgi:hypothetical protein
MSKILDGLRSGPGSGKDRARKAQKYLKNIFINVAQWVRPGVSLTKQNPKNHDPNKKNRKTSSAGCSAY